MTIEEAIKTIEIARAEVEWNFPMGYALAFDIALEALRAQQAPAKLDRNGCEWCNDEYCPTLDWMLGLDHILPGWKYCPMCGRLRTTEARAEAENGNDRKGWN